MGWQFHQEMRCSNRCCRLVNSEEEGEESYYEDEEVEEYTEEDAESAEGDSYYSDEG